MLKTTGILLQEYADYADPEAKLRRTVRDGKLIQLKRGLYETDRKTPGYLLAGAIYGPSYLSFDYALSYYGLIPEQVTVYTSATYNKKKKKFFTTELGMFSYRDVPASAYPIEIRFKNENGKYFQIASPEKALCDKVYDMKTVSNIREMESLLTKDLRIDVDDLKKMDIDIIKEIAAAYPSTNVQLLSKFLKRVISS